MRPTTHPLRRVLLSLLFAVIAAAAPLPRGKLFGHFTGLLPCADCPGIHVDLSLYSGPATYELKQTYESSRHGNPTYTEQGTWLIERGTAKDPQAIVYELHPAHSQSKQFYLRSDKSTLLLLDANREELPPSLPHTLKRTH
jgi:copper homeostasis protein (lipoprotein)